MCIFGTLMEYFKRFRTTSWFQNKFWSCRNSWVTIHSEPRYPSPLAAKPIWTGIQDRLFYFQWRPTWPVILQVFKWNENLGVIGYQQWARHQCLLANLLWFLRLSASWGHEVCPSCSLSHPAPAWVWCLEGIIDLQVFLGWMDQKSTQY